MKQILASVLAVAALTLVTPAFAQEGEGEGDNSGEKKKVKSYDFTGDEIDGDLIKPDGDFIDTRGFADYKSLITIRQDFIREILKSAEDL